MFARYKAEVYFDDQLIYQKRFKSLNNLLKCLSGFDKTSYFEVTDLVFDKVIYDYEVHNYIHELCSDADLESED